MHKTLSMWIATGFKSGNLPFMPGTWGTLLAAIFCYLFLPYFGWHWIILSFVMGMVSIHLVIDQFNDCDPKSIVIDEICGYFLAFYLINKIIPSPEYASIFAFSLFRLFDIWKPFPINWIEEKLSQKKNLIPLGIMFDDLIAALFAGIIVSPYHFF